jgi:hypothetical protein
MVMHACGAITDTIRSSDEGGELPPSSQSTLATQNTILDAPRNEGRQGHYGQRYSPDELAQDVRPPSLSWRYS